MTAPNISMRQLIEGLGAQMAEALKVSVMRPPADRKPFRGVAVLGMGGSGIGGAVLADMVRATSPMPVQAVSDQVLPGWTPTAWWWRRVILATPRRRWQP